ncbi:MAG: hypothetical protein ACRC6V_08360 [Bacteroidales bacterium]
MKTVIKHITLLLLSLWVATACTEDFRHPSEDRIPLAADIKHTIEVDQTTNEVTFKLNNPGCNPVWIFEGKEYSTINGLTRIFAVAGTYEVEIKISNESGVSDGSIMDSFTLDNTIVDFTRYYKMLGGDGTKEWSIAKDEPGHLGCGESGTIGTGWWSAMPNEKADFGVYSNVMTFSLDGIYHFDPKEVGTVYVNAGCTIFPEYNTTGEDFQAPVTEYSVDYSFTVVGNDVYLVLPTKSYLPYIPNDATYNNPTFKIVSIKNNSLELVADNGEIAWHFLLAPTVHELSREDKLAGTWVWKKDAAGHLSCGESGSNGSGWWSAMPNEKADFGIYNHQLIFTADGSYQFVPGETGSFFVNVGCTLFPEYNTTGEDFTVPTTGQNSTWRFVDEGSDTFIEFPTQTIVGYVPNDAAWLTPKFKILQQTDNELHIVIDNGEIAWQYQFIKEGTEEEEDKPIQYDPDSEFNMWKNASFTNSFFYAPNWSEIAPPGLVINGNSYSLSFPQETYEQWQAQVMFLTNITTNTATNYDFCLTLNSNKDLNRVTIKLVKEGDDDTFFFMKMVSLEAYEDYLLSFTNMPGIDMEQVKLVFDFGGNPANTEVNVSKIVLKDHNDDDGSR